MWINQYKKELKKKDIVIDELKKKLDDKLERYHGANYINFKSLERKWNLEYTPPMCNNEFSEILAR